jgi:hypothetical protein
MCDQVAAGFIIALTPFPVVFAMLCIGPQVIARYLLILTLGRVDVEALDDVVEVR